MSNFDAAFEFTKQWEGLYVKDPVDPGGETNRGITDKRDGKIDGLVDVDGDGAGDVKVALLTEDQAKEVYKREYWDVMGCSNRPVDWAVAVFDTAVNCGIARTTLWLEDSQDVKGFLDHRRKHYETLAEKRPPLKKFLKGWMNRLNALHKYIDNLPEEGAPQGG